MQNIVRQAGKYWLSTLTLGSQHLPSAPFHTLVIGLIPSPALAPALLMNMHLLKIEWSPTSHMVPWALPGLMPEYRVRSKPEASKQIKAKQNHLKKGKFFFIRLLRMSFYWFSGTDEVGMSLDSKSQIPLCGKAPSLKGNHFYTFQNRNLANWIVSHYMTRSCISRQKREIQFVLQMSAQAADILLVWVVAFSLAGVKGRVA